MKNIIIYTSIVMFLFSCKENDTEIIDTSLLGKYSTNHLQTIPSIDLNRDGTASENLFDESFMDKSTLQIEAIKNGKGFLSILFPYVYVDTLSTPYFYQEGSNVIHANFTLEENNLVSDNFEIISATILNDSTIDIHFQKEFYLEDEWQNIEMKAVYSYQSK